MMNLLGVKLPDSRPLGSTYTGSGEPPAQQDYSFAAQHPATDEDSSAAAFNALCSDSKSPLLFDCNDQPNRCYFNKLYQPPSSNQHQLDLADEARSPSSPPSPLVERDQEHLLYQGLKFLDSGSSCNEAQQHVQLTKILVDDDEEPDTQEDELDRHLNSVTSNTEDPLDRLQLTAIIDPFDPFGDSPLVDVVQPRDSRLTEPTHHQSEFADHQMDHKSRPHSEAAPTYSADFSHTCSTDDLMQLHFGTAGPESTQYLTNQMEADYSEHLFCRESAHQQQVPVDPVFVEGQQQQQQQQQTALEATDESDCFTQVSSTFDSFDSNSKLTSGQKRPLESELEQDLASSSEKKTNQRPKKRLKSSGSLRSTTPNNVTSSLKSSPDRKRRVSRDLGQEVEFSLDDDDETSSSVDPTRGQGQTPNVYRRRTANARERIRMREINQAFEKLKKVVPVEMIQQVCNSGDESDQTSCSVGQRRSANNTGTSDCSQSVRLTKIATLRLAVSYIAKLSEVLSEHPAANSSAAGDRTSPTTCRAGSATGKTRRSAPGERPRSNQSPQGRKRRLTSSTSKSRLESAGFVHDSSECLVQGQRTPVLVSSNQLVQQSSTPTATFVHQGKPAQLAYQQTVTSDGRTFVTPVAVAILGIPQTTSQDVQVLGMANQHQIQRPTQVATSYPSAHQNQQVTLTLDDLNGLSVLRLSQPGAGLMQAPAQQAIQIQQNRSQLVKQTPTQIVTTAAGFRYNLAPYQPIQIAQLQTGSQILHRLPAATVQHFSGQQLDSAAPIEQKQAIDSRPPQNTGNNSDNKQPGVMTTNGCHLIQATPFKLHHHQTGHFLSGGQLMAISPTGQLFQTQPGSGGAQASLIYLNHPAQSSNSISGASTELMQLVGTRQLSAQPDNQRRTDLNESHVDEREANIRKLVANLTTTIHNPSAKVEQASRSSCRGSGEQTSSLKYHYQSPVDGSANTNDQRYQPQTQVQQQQNTSSPTFNRSQASSEQGQPQASQQPPQHQAQQQQQQQQQQPQPLQQQQPKKTYRFHNYDGNMISNHLYNNNNHSNSAHEKQAGAGAAKRNSQTTSSVSADAQVNETLGVGQRSRQNSLSSTCSTTSSLSSSLASSSPGASLTPTLLVVKSNGMS